MFNETIEKLQFNQIINEVKNRAIGDYSKQQFNHNILSYNLAEVKRKQEETAEARIILDSNQHVPFMGLVQIERLLSEVHKGMILTARELIEVADFLRSNKMMQHFFEKNQFQTPILYEYSCGLNIFSEIEEEIYQKIQNGQLTDDASKNLKRVRKQLSATEKEIETKLHKFLNHPNNQTFIQDKIIIKKGDTYTIPIKVTYKKRVSGNIIEQSNKGQTVYIEPSSITKLNEKLIMLEAEAIAEEYQILAELTGLLSERYSQIMMSIESITAFDMIFARAKYSRDIDGVTPKMNKNELISIQQARHPLLKGHAVPLDFTLGEEYRGIIITGANAGGKTLVLKTVGILILMAMSGIQVPAKEGTTLPVLDHLFVDIGDQQNIENALSTFSGHMKNISTIVKHAGRHSLVLLDEIGSGTEPNEGAGLGIAIMEHLYQSGSLIIATTHYGEIKTFANTHNDFVPARMTFDKETLTPLYQLNIGEIGNSQALWIAKKMSMPKELIDKAEQYIRKTQYPIEKINFKTSSQNNTVTKSDVIFQKGDRVYLNELKEYALVYSDTGKDMVDVFIDNAHKHVLKKRITLVMRATELYPKNYDLDSLFTPFKIRKKQKDLERGSKKAHKQLLDEDIFEIDVK